MFKKFQGFVDKIGMKVEDLKGGDLVVISPIDGSEVGRVQTHSTDDVTDSVEQAQKAQLDWQKVPMPQRGRLVGIFGEVLREYKAELGELVTLECGKIKSEGLGEVQEMIDICEYAAGLSRQIGGQIFSSELEGHGLQERWYPIGVVGIISAFNFPVAVWAWNFALSVVCGNANIWKPSEKTPITAITCQSLFEQAAKRFKKETGISVPEGLSSVLIGHADIGEALVSDKRVALISATGSSAMGLKVQKVVANDLGRSSLLELGGNNAVFITPSAPLELAVESTLFGAIGTAGQRCTTTRRLFIHEDIYEDVKSVFQKAYDSLSVDIIGDPLDKKTLIGPLIDQRSFEAMQSILDAVRVEGGIVTGGERVKRDDFGEDAYYVRPAMVELQEQTPSVMKETFAPVLYVMPYKDLDEAIALNNSVEQGLSSAIFTTNIEEAQIFLDHSDCGIANINNGTSGAEIGVAFGGNKETGGGRESGSDSWKQYMRRSTQRVNYKTGAMQLAQGVEFPIDIDREAIKKIKF